MRFLAAEKLSEHKYKTPEGYLVCVDAVLSRTGKQKYMRSELFGDSCKNPTDEVEVDRLEADVFDEKAMASFENKPICIEHPDEDVNVANHNDLSVGFVRDIKRGTDNGKPVMLGTLVITDENAIDLVESGEYAELSCGYDCDIADDEHPTQRNIRGNHVALCKQGRAGIARIVDSVKDGIPAGYIMIEYTYDGDSWSDYLGRVLVKASSEQDAIAKAKKYAMNTMPEKNPRYFRRSNDMYYNVDVIDMNDFAVMRFDFSTNIAAFERAIVNNDIDEFNAMLSTFEKDITDYHKWKAEGKLSAADVGKVKRQIDKINNLLAKSKINKRFEVQDMATLKDDEYVQLPRGRFKVVAKTKEELEAEGYGYHHSDNGYSVYVKNHSAVAIKDVVYTNEEKALLKNLVGDSKVTDVSDLSGLYKNDDGDAIKVTRNGFSYDVRFGEDTIFNKGWSFSRSYDSTHLLKYLRQNHFTKVSKFDYLKDSIKDVVHTNDANYEQWTKQGWRVAALYKDGGRIHAIVERKSGDFVVALGYNTSTGEWAQGRYVSTFGAAVDTLNEEKPDAVPIRDCMHNAHDSINDADVDVLIGKYTNDPETTISKLGNKIVVELSESDEHNAALISALKKASFKQQSSFRFIKDSVSKQKSYKISFVKNNVMYIRKIKADSLQDAIRKVKDDVSTAHKVVVFTQNILSEMGKNNSIGKYDKVVNAMRQLYGQSLLPDDKLKEVIRRELPRIITKYGLQDMKDVYNKYEHETDKEFLKNAISEIRRYISNWSFMSAREKHNIAPNGFGSLKQDLAFAEKRLAELK